MLRNYINPNCKKCFGIGTIVVSDKNNCLSNINYLDCPTCYKRQRKAEEKKYWKK